MIREFKEFIMRGNVVDLAVGIIIGAAFGSIVTSLVNDMVMPPLGLVLARIDFKDLKVRQYGSTAIVTADADFRDNVEGKINLLHLHVIHVFVKNSHGWQMVARQTTRYPEPATTAKK